MYYINILGLFMGHGPAHGSEEVLEMSRVGSDRVGWGRVRSGRVRRLLRIAGRGGVRPRLR